MSRYQRNTLLFQNLSVLTLIRIHIVDICVTNRTERTCAHNVNHFLIVSFPVTSILLNDGFPWWCEHSSLIFTA